MTLYMAFQADCQYAGMMRCPSTSEANVILLEGSGARGSNFLSSNGAH